MWYSINLIVIFTMAFSALMVSSPPTPVQAVVSFDGTIYTQNFDSLSNTGTSNPWTNDSTLPGWFIGTTATPSITSYGANNGSVTTASFYSFGSTSAADRALGAVSSNSWTGGSGSGKNYMGVLLQNTSTQTITGLSVSYHGEEWRRENNAATQSLELSYKISASAVGLQDTGFSSVAGLSFVSPVTGATTAAVLDGNLATNSATLTGAFPVYWPVNSYLMLRWSDLNDSGYDHVLAIDDLSVQIDNTDFAPFVVLTTPANGASGVATDTEISVLFNEPVTAASGWYSINCSSSGVHTATETVNGQTYTLDPDTAFTAAETCTLTVDKDKVTDLDGTADPMLAAYTMSFMISACGSTHTAISAIQGSGMISPVTSTVVTVEGIVSADFSPTAKLGGFFITSLPADDDASTDTSEGIFVYTGGSTAVNVGDYVRFSGTVSEYNSGSSSYGQPYNQTQLSSISGFEVCGTGYMPPVATITLPIPGDPATYLERYEGMLVNISAADGDPMVVGQNYFQGRFGQLTIGIGKVTDRMFHAYNGSDTATYAENLQSLIVLDDGSSTQNPNPISYLATNGALRAGDSVASLTGILDQGKVNAVSTVTSVSFPNVYYRLQPVIAPVFIQTNPRVAEPPVKTAEVRVASANVLNYFTTIGSRGASSAAELIRQRCKIVAELSRLDADVIGLLEIENNATAIDNLLNFDDTSASNCDGLNLVLPGTEDDYAVIAEPDNGYGTDAIRPTIIYRPSKVTPVGSPMSLVTAPFNLYRPPVAQKFVRKDTGESFIYIINHFKSKGCSGTETGGDVDQGEGIGCYNATRVTMSQVLLDWINTTLVPLSPNVISMGDYNAYGAEQPIATLTAELTSMAEALLPPEERYSYVFDGMVGDLDHGFATPALATQAVTMTIWHINSDEPSVIDYNTEYKNPDLYQPDQYRASDHDPVLIDFNLNDAPVAVSDTYHVTQDVTLTATVAEGVLANDTDTGNDTLTVALTKDVDHGVLVLNADGSFTYTPAGGYYGADTFMYRPSDASLAGNSTTVTLNVNAVPVAVGDSYSVDEDATLTVPATVGVLANDTDADVITLTAVLANDVTHGVLVLNADGSFSYTPSANYNGPDSFMYKTYDGLDYSSSVTVTLTVNPVNDAPVVANPLADDTWTAFSAGSLTFASDAFTDIDSTLTYTATLADGSPLPAWLSFDGSTRTFSGTPTNADAGTLTIKVTASDSSLSVSDSFTLTIVKIWFKIFMPFISMP